MLLARNRIDLKNQLLVLLQQPDNLTYDERNGALSVDLRVYKLILKLSGSKAKSRGGQRKAVLNWILRSIKA